MFGLRIQLMLFIALLAGIWAMQTRSTSADLVAERKIAGNTFSITTLSFANINTANFSQLVQFFDTQGIVPGGFDARTVRIEKQGKLDVKYTLQALQKSGDDALCKALHIQIVRRDMSDLYKGKLMDLSFTDTLTNDEFDEWIILLSLDQKDEALKGTSCGFDLYMRTYRNDPKEELAGIHAIRTLTNTVTTGTW